VGPAKAHAVGLPGDGVGKGLRAMGYDVFPSIPIGGGLDPKSTLPDVNLSESKVLQTASSPQYHLVQEGQSLSGLAKEFYGDYSKYPLIQKANNITDPNII